MITIQKETGPVTVMVIMETAAENLNELLEISLANQATFAAQPGFVSAALHRGAEDTRLVQYLQWESREAHEACTGSPDWDNEVGRAFVEFFRSGRGRMNAQIYRVVEAIEGG